MTQPATNQNPATQSAIDKLIYHPLFEKYIND